MDEIMEDALLKLSESIRDIRVKRAEMEKMQKEVDEKKKEFEKMNKDMSEKPDDPMKRNELLGGNENERRRKAVEDLMIALNERAKAMEELGKTNMKMDDLKKKVKILKKEIEEYQKETEKLQKEIEEYQKETEKLQKEIEEYQIVSMKRMFYSLFRHKQETKDIEAKKKDIEAKKKDIEAKKKDIEAKKKEIEELQETISSKRNEMEKLEKGKDIETLKEEQMKAKEERDKNLREIEEIKKRDTGPLEETVRNKLEEIRRLRNEIEHVEKETDKKRSELVELQRGFKELKIWQYDFIDDEIKPRLESYLKEIDPSDGDRLLELESMASDTLDDVRLLLLEHIKRGCGQEILSVVKLCSNPNVKVISTKKNIQKSFIDSAKVLLLDKEKSDEILDESKVLMSCGVLLESDIVEVLNFPCSCPDPVTAVVKITIEPSNLPFLDIQVVLKSENDWEIITTHPQEGYVEFPFRRMKYLFVISREKWVSHTLSPRGLNYKFDEIEHVTVRFPPRSVRKNCEIRLQVIPPNPVEQTEFPDPNVDSDPDVDTYIVSVSPRLWVLHDDVLKFETPFVVTLPLPPVSSTETETDLCLIKWTDGDDVNIADTSIQLKEGFCEFEVDGFSGCSVARLRGRNNKLLLKSEIDAYYMSRRGLPKECQILILSDKSAVNTLWIEIVESNRVEDLLKVRLEQQHLVQITNILFPTMSVRYGQIMKIYATGGIQMHSNYQADFLTIKFTEKASNNHLRFEVELKDPNLSAMLILQLKKGQIYRCHFDAIEFLRQRSETSQTAPEAGSKRHALLTANKTLHIKSIQALARQIPIRQTEELARELNLSDNEVEDIKANQYKGIQMTYQVLSKWRQKSVKEASDMIKELATALNTLSLNNMAAKLLIASQERRSLENEDFAE